MKANPHATADQAPAGPDPAQAPTPPTTRGPVPGVAMPRLEPTLPDGLRLGAFEIKGVIAHSHAAVVYRVSDHSLGIPAAIKEYMPLGVARRGSGHQVVAAEAWHEDTIDLGRRAFFAESRALARCDDPALLRVTQLWEINGTAYRVMPLYSGKRLVDLRREMRAPIDETALRAMLERLLDALGAYHASAGVHGNVTPMNILMPALDRPVLLGPGKASVLLATELGEPLRSDFEAAFAAPEQHEAADAAVIGPAADLFGLAQTLRFAITGAAPIGHESLRASIHRLLGARAVSNYSDALLDALSSATATAPAERPQTLDEFRQRLRRLEAQSAAAAVPVQAPVATAAAPAAPSHAPPQAASPAVDMHGDDPIDETIDVSSVLGDLLQEPAEPPVRADQRPQQDRPEHAADPRLEAALNYVQNIPVSPVHEAPRHATHAAQTQTSHVRVEQREPHPPQPPGAHAPAAPDQTSAAHASLYDYDYGDSGPIAATLRPEPKPAAPVLRMSAFVAGFAALAIVVILVVSGVWEPGKPDQNLPPKTTPGFAAAPPPPLPAPVGELPASADPAGPAATAEIPAPSAAPAPMPAPQANAIPRTTEVPATAAAPVAMPAPQESAIPRTPEVSVPDAAPAAIAAPQASASIAGGRPQAPRENTTSRRRNSTSESTSDPREACAGRTQFALYRCMQAQCGRPRWAAHPECVRLRKSDRVDPS